MANERLNDVYRPQKVVIAGQFHKSGEAWMKVATFTHKIAEQTHSIVMLVTASFRFDTKILGGDGILAIKTQANLSLSGLEKQSITWLFADEFIPINDFKLLVSGVTLELWIRADVYNSYTFTILTELEDDGLSSEYVFYNKPNEAAKPSEGYDEITSSVAKLLQPAG